MPLEPKKPKLNPKKAREAKKKELKRVAKVHLAPASTAFYKGMLSAELRKFSMALEKKFPYSANTAGRTESGWKNAIKSQRQLAHHALRRAAESFLPAEKRHLAPKLAEIAKEINESKLTSAGTISYGKIDFSKYRELANAIGMENLGLLKDMVRDMGDSPTSFMALNENPAALHTYLRGMFAASEVLSGLLWLRSGNW